MPGDPELLARVSGGDVAAMERIYERHAAAVYNASMRILGRAGLAADVTQEVFMTLLGKTAAIEDPSRLRAWLIRTAVNRSIDWWRKGKGEPVSLELPSVRLVAERDRDGEGPLEQLMAREEEEQLSRAILALSPPLREVVVLRYVEGMSYTEIADISDIGLGTVKSRIFRAHQMLQRLMDMPEPR